MQCLNLGDYHDKYHNYNDETSGLKIHRKDLGSAKGMWNLIDFTSKGSL